MDGPKVHIVHRIANFICLFWEGPKHSQINMYLNFIDLPSSGFSQNMVLLKTKWYLNFQKLFKTNQSFYLSFFKKQARPTKIWGNSFFMKACGEQPEQLNPMVCIFITPFLCFQGGFFGKFCPYIWLVFKSGLWWRAYGM